MLSAGEGISITGSGQPADPYVVTAEVTSFAAAFQALDTATVNMSLVGVGTVVDPFLLSATSQMSMQQLVDVDDPSGPALGEVPVWNGLAFEFAAPPSAPPGAVNVGSGLFGDGSFGDPITVAVSDVTTDTTSGLGIYVDTAGELRAVAPTSSTVAWADVVGKPSTFTPTIGTTSTTAKAGDWFPTWSQVTGKPTTSTLDGRTIYQGTTAPSAGLGVNSDIYLLYT